jgi:hypothetical protein
VHEDYRAKVERTVKEALERQQDAQVDFVFSNGNWVKGHVRWWPLGLVGASILPKEGEYVVLILQLPDYDRHVFDSVGVSHARETASLIFLDTRLYEESLTKRAEEAEERRIEAEERRRGQEVGRNLEGLWCPLMSMENSFWWTSQVTSFASLFLR